MLGFQHHQLEGRMSSTPTHLRLLYPETPRQSTRTQQNPDPAQGTAPEPMQQPQQPQQPVQAQQQVAPTQPATPEPNQIQSGPSQVSTEMMYQGSQPVTPQQQALFSQVSTAQSRLVCQCCHATADGKGTCPRIPK